MSTHGENGIFVCPPTAPELFPADGIVAVGFGSASVLRDGVAVWQEQGADQEDMTGAMAEAMAAADPAHDWRISLYAPLSSAVYQRQGPGQWVLIERGEGFA